MRRWARSCAATGSRPACPRRSPSPTARRCACRLLGENLVVFRDTKGRLGVLDEYCAHRRASLRLRAQRGVRAALPLSRLEVRREGNVVEMASEPPGSTIPERVKHKAYPAREAGGFVWCYMGPADEMPEFEPPAFAPTPDARVSATKVRVRCNWAQILEGQIDSAHSSSLHSSDMVPGAGRRREGDRSRTGCGPRPTRRRASRSSAPATASATRRSAARSRTRRRTITSAPRSTSRRSRR